MGAWIETIFVGADKIGDLVAPLVGAWIETDLIENSTRHTSSHPSWVRGLKRKENDEAIAKQMSHPSWVRGLKLHLLEYHLRHQRRTPRGCVD